MPFDKRPSYLTQAVTFAIDVVLIPDRSESSFMAAEQSLVFGWPGKKAVRCVSNGQYLVRLDICRVRSRIGRTFSRIEKNERQDNRPSRQPSKAKVYLYSGPW